jgi:hypothetical protein
MTTTLQQPEEFVKAPVPSSISDPDPRARVGRSALPFVPRAIFLCLVPAAVVAVMGLPYYLLPLSERLLSPLHAWFKPAGYVGQSAGFVALALFLFLWLYPIRKKFRFLSFTGSVPRWLDVHIVAGILVPPVGAIHAAWRFEGLIGLGYGAMLVVAMSGVVGRYLYLHIPRSRDGLELSREGTAGERRRIVGEIIASTGLSSDTILRLLDPSPGPRRGEGIVKLLGRMIADDLARRRAIRDLLREWKCALRAGPAPNRKRLREVGRLARREMGLAQQIRMLEGTNRVFRFWHAAHRPFAVTAFLAVIVHVAVVVVLGTTWIG